MIILNKEVLNFVGHLYQAPREHLKNLSQSERRYCMTTLQSLSNNKARVVQTDQHRFIQGKIAIAPSKNLGIIRATIRALVAFIKGVLNLLHLRISSQALNDQLDQVKLKYLEYAKKLVSVPEPIASSPEQFVIPPPPAGAILEGAPTWEEHMSSRAKMMVGDPNAARIYFVGDGDHLDPCQKEFQFQFINKYAQAGDLVLLESIQSLTVFDNSFPNYERFIRKIDKDLAWWGWDDKQIGDKIVKIYRQFLVHLHKFKGLRSPTMKDIIKMKLKTKEYERKDKKYGKIRNQSLIYTVKTLDHLYKKTLNLQPKIFVLAGQSHFIDEHLKFNVLDHFKDHHCFLFMQKRIREEPHSFEEHAHYYHFNLN